MTKFLASAATPEEAIIALNAGADIIDLKDPASGALGAVSDDIVRQTVARVAGARPVSATIGDGTSNLDSLEMAVAERSMLGVDFVKVGFSDRINRAKAIDKLAPAARSGTQIIAVFFADQPFDPSLLEHARAAAFAGVMFDTENKATGSLTDKRSLAELKAYVSEAHHLGLQVGLAGSLSAEDVPVLLPLHPDTLGFRGALCAGGGRTAPLDSAACANIRSLIPEHEAQYDEPDNRLDFMVS